MILSNRQFLAACVRNLRTSRRSRMLVVWTPNGTLLAEDLITSKLRTLVDSLTQLHNEAHLITAAAKTYLLSRIVESITIGQLPPLQGANKQIVAPGNNRNRSLGGVAINNNPGSDRQASLSNQLSRKQGLLRHNCLGKRVNGTGRGPVTNDHLLPSDVILVPQLITETMRVNHPMTAAERPRLERFMRSGCVHGVFFPMESRPVDFKSLCRYKTTLRPTDVILRQSPDGNIVKIPHPAHIQELRFSDVVHRGHRRHRVSDLLILPHIPDGTILYMEPLDGTHVIIIRQPTIYVTSMPAVRMYRSRCDAKCIFISSATIFGMLGDFDCKPNRTKRFILIYNVFSSKRGGMSSVTPCIVFAMDCDLSACVGVCDAKSRGPGS